MIDELLLDSSERIRRARLFAWFCGGLSFLALSLTFLIVLTLAQMGARFRVLAHPVLFLPMKSGNIVTIDPLDTKNVSADLITEAFLREFIINRHSVIPDVGEMVRRFSYGGPIHRFSSTKLYAPYANQRETKKMKKEEAEGATPVDVEIRNVSHIGRNWTVEFDKRTVLGPEKVSVQSFIASIEVRYLPSHISYNPEALNPLGMTITRYEDYPMKRQ